LCAQITWNSKYSLLFIDNPVGAGFSYTGDDAGYARNMDDVATNLYSTLAQFFVLFPQYAANDFYVTGESYAGKVRPAAPPAGLPDLMRRHAQYVPSIAAKIHAMNAAGASPKIALRGIAIGVPLPPPRVE
jgi:vitellogenic carboxypeptidase-like protein